MSWRARRRYTKKRPVLGPLAIVLLCIVGGAVFWYGVSTFRAQARERQAARDLEAQSVVPVETFVLENPILTLKEGEVLRDEASLFSTIDNQSTGRVTRVFERGEARFSVLAYLPALDGAQASYEVWLLKDGLADVRDMGELVVRADGSWVLDFIANPANGIADPHTYVSVVIMREPRDGNSAPSGDRIAEGRFSN